MASCTSGLAPVDDKGTVLFYEDSGSPTNIPYTTLVLFHGGVFHSAIYHRLVPYANQNDLRLVLVNFRDYPQSTPYSHEELQTLRSSDADIQASFLKDRGSEIASFLAWFVRKERIPPIDRSSEPFVGGLAFLGWSWGNCMLLSFLGHASGISVETRELLEKYLRTYVIFDPPLLALGEPEPPIDALYHPFYDTSIPSDQLTQKISVWVSSHYNHSSTILSSITTIGLTELLSGFSHLPADHPPPTSVTMTANELAGVIDSDVIQRSHQYMELFHRSIYLQNAEKSLKADVWPKLRAIHIWCDQSPGVTMYSAWLLAKRLRESTTGYLRQVEIKRMEGVNHFPHWERPEFTLKFLADEI